MRSFSRSAPFVFLVQGSALAVLLGLAGCGTPPRSPYPDDARAFLAALPTLAGDARYFEQRVSLVMKLGPAEQDGYGHPPGVENGAPRDPRGGDGPKGVGMGVGANVGMGGVGIGGGVGGGGGNGRRRERGGDEPSGREMGGGPGASAEQQNPLLRFELSITNLSEEVIDLHDGDVVSALGAFSVKPDKITLQPHQTFTAEPMLTRLGVPEGDFPVTLKFSLGKKSETQVLTLAKENAKSVKPTANP